MTSLDSFPERAEEVRAVLIATIKGSLMHIMTQQAFPLDCVAAEVERWLTGTSPSSSPSSADGRG